MSEVPGMTKLTEALVKAQAAMTPAKKDSQNPHFKSTYADLSSIIESVRKPLTDNGLAFVQLLSGAAAGVTVVTRLLHVSGESIETSCWMPVTQQSPQAFGSAATYCKRYALAALLGIATEDDDGNSATTAKGVVPAPQGVEAFKAALAAAHPHNPADDASLPLGAPEDGPCPPYGRGKGKKWSELDMDGLKFYEGGSLKSLSDPSKESYHPREVRNLAIARSWIQFRS